MEKYKKSIRKTGSVAYKVWNSKRVTRQGGVTVSKGLVFSLLFANQIEGDVLLLL
ncbi:MULTISPECIES: hypothetical protein [Arenibacter]|uniref:hypothetical protein n=1 Tax=Arenibacter TaxID=178469 RepID=UPI000855A101|nr:MULTISPECIES: hypothetical protein [Arenibacter]GBF18587.1 hypothetical protein C21_00747 [Arenibacter sp. NBRC 103722]